MIFGLEVKIAWFLLLLLVVKSMHYVNYRRSKLPLRANIAEVEDEVADDLNLPTISVGVMQ